MDICIRGARLMDPAQQIDCHADLAVSQGKIMAVGSQIAGQADLEIDGTDCLLVPGLVDMHAHVGGSEVAVLSLPVDEAGLLRGVTHVVDAGTAGVANMDCLLAQTAQAQTPVSVFLNAHPYGIASLPQDWSQGLDVSAMDHMLEQLADHITGIKVIASAAFAAHIGLKGLRQLKSLAGQHCIPLMIHLGTEHEDTLPADWERFCGELPAILDAGDILSHCFTGKPGGLITPDKRFYPQLRDAVRRGVALDAAVALRHFDFSRARQGLEDGFSPRTISTDLTRNNEARSVFDLPTTMSRFIALGMSLGETVSCTTRNPRLLLRQPEVIIRQGEPAVLSLLREHHGPCLYGDGDNAMPGSYMLTPEGVIWHNTFLPSTRRDVTPAIEQH